MTWLQENWIVAIVGVLFAILLVWGLLGRRKANDMLPPAGRAAEPKKPLEPVRPDIVAAEPARFKSAQPAAEPAKTPEFPEQAETMPMTPAPAGGDNLQLLKGVGPKLAALLNAQSVTSFAQVAAWTETDIAAIDPQLGAFKGRIARDNLVDQASYLARGDKAGFEAKYGALGGEL